MTLTGWIRGILTGITDEKLLDTWIFKGVSEEEKEKIKTGYPQKAWNGGVVRELRPSVLMLERGYVFNIDGCKCFAFGGARSHDISGGILQPADFNTKKDAENEAIRWQYQGRAYRINHISWWEHKVDFIFSHECPVSDKAMIVGDGSPDALSSYLEKVKKKVDYKKWFFGHYHGNMMIPGGKDILLYEQFIQIN